MFWGRVLSQDRFGLSNFELNVGVSENSGTLFWGPYNKDPTIQGTILGSPIFGNSHVEFGVWGLIRARKHQLLARTQDCIYLSPVVSIPCGPGKPGWSSGCSAHSNSLGSHG